MEALFRLLVYAASVWVSNQYAAGYWVVGPVFGAAVVTFDLKGFKDLNLPKHGIFIALSTLIYALVYRISRLEWGGDTDLFHYVIGSFPAAIVTGSVLMSVLHTVVFNKSKELMVRSIATLVGSYFAVTLVMYINEKSNLGFDVPWIALLIAAWQGLYLYTFFGKEK